MLLSNFWTSHGDEIIVAIISGLVVCFIAFIGSKINRKIIVSKRNKLHIEQIAKPLSLENLGRKIRILTRKENEQDFEYLEHKEKMGYKLTKRENAILDAHIIRKITVKVIANTQTKK
jgi:hypothetical protein